MFNNEREIDYLTMFSIRGDESYTPEPHDSSINKNYNMALGMTKNTST